jgi:hypothetical protein
VLTKTINYGNASASSIAWRKKILMPMSYSDSSTDGAYLSEAMKSDYLNAAGYSSWTMYMRGSVCAAANSSFTPNQELIDGATQTRWNSNSYGMVWWWGHGSSTGASLGYSGCGWGTIMNSTGAASLNDNYPAFVYQCSCNNGYPETTNNLGTALLYNGAINTVSASRVSWYAVTSWYSGLKYYCDNASIGYYYGRQLTSGAKDAASALYYVKADMGASHYTAWGGSHWMNLFDFNLYGEPSMSLDETGTPSGNTYLLLSRQDNNRGCRWTMNSSGNVISGTGYAVSGWEATGYHHNSDGTSQMLWYRSDGDARLWNLNANGNYVSSYAYKASGYKFADWHRNLDGTGQLLLTKPGVAVIWNINASGGIINGRRYEIAGWEATGYHRNCDGTAYLLWTQTGKCSIWTLNTDWSVHSGRGFTAPNWKAHSIHRNSDGTFHILWWRPSDQRISIWKLNSTFGFMSSVSTRQIGWTATSYHGLGSS